MHLLNLSKQRHRTCKAGNAFCIHITNHSGKEDPLEKGMPTHSSILAWRIPWMEEPGGLHSPTA